MHNTIDLETDFSFMLNKCMLKNISTNKRIFFKSQNWYLSQTYLKLTYFCYVIKYFYYFKNSIIL